MRTKTWSRRSAKLIILGLILSACSSGADISKSPLDAQVTSTAITATRIIVTESEPPVLLSTQQIATSVRATSQAIQTEIQSRGNPSHTPRAVIIITPTTTALTQTPDTTSNLSPKTGFVVRPYPSGFRLAEAMCVGTYNGKFIERFSSIRPEEYIATHTQILIDGQIIEYNHISFSPGNEEGIQNFSVCFSTEKLALGQHIGIIHITAMSSIEYSYVWQFIIEETDVQN